MCVRERAVLIVNPAAGKRHAEDADLAECVRLLGAAGFDIDRRDTGADGPTSPDLARSADADGCRGWHRGHRGRIDRAPRRPADTHREQSLLRLGAADRPERRHDRWTARRGDLPAKGKARAHPMDGHHLAHRPTGETAAPAAGKGDRARVVRGRAGPRRRSDRGPPPGHRALLRRRATRVRMNFRPMSTHVRTWMLKPESVPVTLPSRSAARSSCGVTNGATST